jgi:NAD(P)-dependent dehydrogenase (short-subunit alcohol dehydrogenase family)
VRHVKKKALVTGAGSGIGKAIALELGAKGAAIAVLDVDSQKAAEVAREIADSGPEPGLPVHADVSNYSEVHAAVRHVVGEFERIDILVNNAGILEYCDFRDLTEEMWDRMLAVNLKGAFNCTKATIDGMIAHEYGRIVNVSSVAGVTGTPQHSHYSAAKAGLIGMTKSIAKEVGPMGITVNAIAPGLIDTAVTLGPAFPADLREHYVSSTPLGRTGRPEDVAYTASFLASDQAAFITGQVISPNGGFLI